MTMTPKDNFYVGPTTPSVSFGGMLVFHADLNSVMDDGSVAVSRRFASSKRNPQVGETVVIADHECNSYHAEVVSVTDKAVQAQVDFDSWRSDLHVSRSDEMTGFLVTTTPELEHAVA